MPPPSTFKVMSSRRTIGSFFIFFSQLDNEFPLHDLLLLHPFVVCGTQGSDCVLIEDITSTSLPPRMIQT